MDANTLYIAWQYVILTVVPTILVVYFFIRIFVACGTSWVCWVVPSITMAVVLFICLSLFMEVQNYNLELYGSNEASAFVHSDNMIANAELAQQHSEYCSRAQRLQELQRLQNWLVYTPGLVILPSVVLALGLYIFNRSKIGVSLRSRIRNGAFGIS